jgi:hypothetical protein
VSGDGHFRIRYSIAVIRWFDFASRYIRLRRSCRLMGGFVISPLPHVVERNIHRSGPFPPDAFCCTSINGVGSEVAHRVAPMLATVRRSVGSRAGARTVGSGGDSIAFAMDRSPVTMVTFPAPATSNAACGFPALRFPVCFVPGFMRPVALGALSTPPDDEPYSR